MQASSGPWYVITRSLQVTVAVCLVVVLPIVMVIIGVVVMVTVVVMPVIVVVFMVPVIVVIAVVMVIGAAAEGSSGVVHLLLQSTDLPLEELLQRAGVGGGGVP